jgi:hypothetical protein
MSEHIDDFIEGKARKDGAYAIAYALLQLANAQKETARAVRSLDVPMVAERIDCGAGAIADALRSGD